MSPPYIDSTPRPRVEGVHYLPFDGTGSFSIGHSLMDGVGVGP